MTETEVLTAARVPTVYFIDDSATMREVIKIAFRKENIRVITCPDAASALSQFRESAPDAVITDVIMPDKDGYEVCQFIKQHKQLGNTPVILMSGVVNRSVAEKATAVKADELIRKPFQPHELIARVKNLLTPKSGASSTADSPSSHAVEPSKSASFDILSNLFSPATRPAPVSPASKISSGSAVSASALLTPAQNSSKASPSFSRPAAAPVSGEIQKLRSEVRRLELLVKKLQIELEAEHQYCIGLEEHLRKLQET